jgi:hypothetical protein
MNNKLAYCSHNVITSRSGCTFPFTRIVLSALPLSAALPQRRQGITLGGIVFDSKTVHDRIDEVNWHSHRSRPYVIIDPYSGELLYLDQGTYLKMVQIAMSNQQALVVVAHPGSSPADVGLKAQKESSTPVSGSSNKPNNSPLYTTGWLGPFAPKYQFSTRARRVWSPFTTFMGYHFQSWRFGSTLVSTYESELRAMVKEVDSNTSLVKVRPSVLDKLLYAWMEKVFFWSHGRGPNPRERLSQVQFAMNVRRHVREHGLAYTLQVLKFSLFALNTSIGGKQITNSRLYGHTIGMRRGLPLLLPAIARSDLHT